MLFLTVFARGRYSCFYGVNDIGVVVQTDQAPIRQLGNCNNIFSLKQLTSTTLNTDLTSKLSFAEFTLVDNKCSISDTVGLA